MRCAPVASLRITALLVTVLVVACKPGDSNAAAETIATDSAGSTSSTTPSASDAPVATPAPWVPYAIEKQLGAQWCPQGVADEQVPDARVRSSGFLNQPCFGVMPKELIDVFLAIPDKDIFLSAETRAEQARQPQPYLALPGQGARPDLMASVDLLEGITLRSFEGKSATDTVYLVQGPFHCIDNDPHARREGEYLVDSAACKSAQAATRLFKWSSPGVLSDVTAQYLPPPQPTTAEQAVIEPGTLALDLTRLTQVPVMRWNALPRNRNAGAGHDSDEPIALPADIAAKHQLPHGLHFGFVVWDGTRFQSQQRVPRAFWPVPYCDPTRPNPRCEDRDDSTGRYADPFVDEPRTPPARSAS